jgi:hypothetical protein
MPGLDILVKFINREYGLMGICGLGKDVRKSNTLIKVSP